MSISAQEPHGTHHTARTPSRNIFGVEMLNAIHLESKRPSGTQPPDPQVILSASRSRAGDMEPSQSESETGVHPSGRLGLLGHPRAVDLYEARMCT